MIKYLTHEEIDIDKWDDTINKSFNGLVYATSWYLDLVHEDWGALVENDYERVMPLTANRKFGVNYIHQPFFVQQLGVFSITMLEPKVIQNFIEHIPVKYKFVEFNLNSFNKTDNLDCEIVTNKNHVLDLINEYPKISTKFSKQTKRNLKKSQKNNLTLMKNIKPEAVIKLFRENRGKYIAKWKDHHYKILTHLMHSAIYKNRGMIYGVFTRRNELVAGAFFLKFRNRLIFLFSGIDEEARQNAAMTFLIDGVIQEHSPNQLVLDFEGSNDENLARFYKGFGAKEIDYSGVRMNNLSFPLKQFFKVYKKIKNN